MDKKNSKFRLGDKMGYVSPFEESPFRKEWAERREREEEVRREERLKREKDYLQFNRFRSYLHEDDGIYISSKTPIDIKEKVVKKLSSIIGVQLELTQKNKLVISQTQDENTVSKPLLGFGEKIKKLITDPRALMSEIMFSEKSETTPEEKEKKQEEKKKSILSDDKKAFNLIIVIKDYEYDYLSYGQARLNLIKSSNEFIFSQRIFKDDTVTNDYVAHLWLHEIIETLALKVNLAKGHDYDRDHYFAQKTEIELIKNALNSPKFTFEFDRKNEKWKYDWTYNAYGYPRDYFENTMHDFGLNLDRYVMLDTRRSFTEEEAKEIEYSSAYLEVLFKNEKGQYIDVGFYLFKPFYALKAKETSADYHTWKVEAIFFEVGMRSYLDKKLPPKQ